MAIHLSVLKTETEEVLVAMTKKLSVLAAGSKNHLIQDLTLDQNQEMIHSATVKDQLAALHAAADLALLAKEEKALHLAAAKDLSAAVKEDLAPLLVVEKEDHLAHHLVAAKDAHLALAAVIEDHLVRHLAAVKENLTPKALQEDQLELELQALKSAGSSFRLLKF